jgi:hypothetical protein
VINNLYNNTLNVYDSIKTELKKEAFRIALHLAIDKETLCRLNSSCFSYNLNYSLEHSCKDLSSFYQDINNISLNNTAIRKTIASEYLNSSYYPDYKDAIDSQQNISFNNLPAKCNKKNLNLNTKFDFTAKRINVKIKSANINLSFNPIPYKCCVKGNCKECCTNSSCLKEEPYPVLFLHGHAFNKGLSADYNLDAFNKIFEKLESKGYVNAGAISLYTDKDIKEYTWGISKAPLLVKASYYYDFLHSSDDYVTVQLNSENIDTYAVRLKEILDILESKAGNEKVIII